MYGILDPHLVDLRATPRYAHGRAWGGKTIDVDFRPPSSARADPTHPVGPYRNYACNAPARDTDPCLEFIVD